MTRAQVSDVQQAPVWYLQVAPLSSESSTTQQMRDDATTASQERMKRELGVLVREVSRVQPLVVQDLQAAGVVRELPLDFLSRDDVRRYLAMEFPDHRFPKEFEELVHAKTEGSPLFMVDLLRYLRDRVSSPRGKGTRRSRAGKCRMSVRTARPLRLSSGWPLSDFHHVRGL